MLKDISIHIKENISSDLTDYDKSSSVALKYCIGDEVYGQVIRVDKPILSAHDVVSIANVLLKNATLLREALIETKEGESNANSKDS